jgi:hypothetical protein
MKDRPSRGLLVGVAAAALLVLTACDRAAEAPTTDHPPVATFPDAGAKAEEVARGFLEAYGALDVDQARTYLADDATIASVGAQDDLRLLISWLEAVGYKHTLDPCEELNSFASGATLRCPFDFHSIRSDEIRLGPFSGSFFIVTVRDGEIVQVSQDWEIEQFSPQVWEPFADWVSTAYPADAAVMYLDESYSSVRLTEEAIRLWERHSRGYVKEAGL